LSAMEHEHDQQGEDLVHMRASGGPVEIRIASAAGRHALPGALASVRISGHANDQSAVFTLAADDDGESATATVEVAGNTPLTRTVRLEPPSESTLLAEEMEAYGRERAYDDALQTAGRIVELVQTGQ
ncbi:MAG: hypothetical protein ACR2PL_09935, partial [Dehalococcoidia bacterium]